MPDSPLDMLPPWDAALWYQPLAETTYNLTGTFVKVVVGDPYTALILFAAPIAIGGFVFVTTNPRAATNTGYVLSPQSPNLRLDYRDFGPLVGYDWYASASPGLTLTVQVLKLKGWPRGPICGKPPSSPVPRRVQRVCRARLNSPGTGQPASSGGSAVFTQASDGVVQLRSGSGPGSGVPPPSGISSP